MFKLFRRLLPSAPVADEAPARVSRPTSPPLPDELIAPLRRTCWRPNVQSGDDPLRSKFSGTPAATPGESWPACANCGKPLQLFVQLDPADLPPELTAPWGSGLLQFFYCTSSDPHCEVDCEAYFPFAKSVLLRILEGPVTGAPGRHLQGTSRPSESSAGIAKTISPSQRRSAATNSPPRTWTRWKKADTRSSATS